MRKRANIIVIVLVAVVLSLSGVYVAIESAEATDKRSAVSSDMREIVSASIGGPISPLDANAEITHLLTPADPALPGFFSVPTTSGRACIVTSDAVISSCIQKDSPGTVTVRDDSEGDGSPPFVYGLARPEVVSVWVLVNGKKEQATFIRGFYLLQLGSPDARVEAVQRVGFVLNNGETQFRHVTS